MIIKTIFYRDNKRGIIVVKGFDPSLIELYKAAGYKTKFIYDSLN